MAAGSSLLPNSAPSLRPGSNKTGRKVFVGLPVQTLAIGFAGDIKVDVLEEFKMNRLFLSPAAQALQVSNIRMGTKPLNVSSNPISGNVFSEAAINNELSGYTAEPGTGIILGLINTTGATCVLSGGFTGWAAL